MNMKPNLILLLACLVTHIALAESSLAEMHAAENAAIKREWESWNAPFKPFRLVGNIHYVGASGISSFLITTPEGHILLDTGFETTVPRIREALVKFVQGARKEFNSGKHRPASPADFMRKVPA